jgi:hypothetical protein
MTLKPFEKGNKKRFDPSTVPLNDIVGRLKPTAPSGSARLSQSGLPIDEFVSRELIDGNKLKNGIPVQWSAGCPFALARQLVSLAASQSHRRHDLEIEVKTPVKEALEYLKDNIPKLNAILNSILSRIQTVRDGAWDIGTRLSKVEDAYEALTLAEYVVPNAQRLIAALHLELSQESADIWRNAFITTLFPAWWLLTGLDPKPKQSPFQRFVIASWCSLSPRASAADWDWESAIAIALKHSKPGQWRAEPPEWAADQGTIGHSTQWVRPPC